MYLIAGLGNPGDKYKTTRHNIGFLVIDEITKNLSTSKINNSNFKAEVYKASNIVYAKPQTFMNNSGESIVAIADYYKIPNENIIVIHDDLDLAFLALKFKKGGSSGGHNGLKSIDQHIGNDYIRVRVGIGKPKEKKEVINWVLDNFSKEEFEKLCDTMPHIIKAIDALINTPLEKVKSLYSKK